eukprot:2602436-Amphidinium_carterae.1
MHGALAGKGKAKTPAPVEDASAAEPHIHNHSHCSLGLTMTRFMLARLEYPEPAEPPVAVSPEPEERCMFLHWTMWQAQSQQDWHWMLKLCGLTLGIMLQEAPASTVPPKGKGKAWLVHAWRHSCHSSACTSSALGFGRCVIPIWLMFKL